MTADLGFTPKKRNLKEGVVPKIFARKSFDVINMDSERSVCQPRKLLKRMMDNTQNEKVRVLLVYVTQWFSCLCFNFFFSLLSILLLK